MASNGTLMIIEELAARKRLLSVEELSELLGQSADSIYRARKAGRLPYLKFGGQIKFDPKELIGWIEEHHVGK
jgi:excisionase family DNA binding protein